MLIAIKKQWRTNETVYLRAEPKGIAYHSKHKRQWNANQPATGEMAHD
jgi:hypothetical protein